MDPLTATVVALGVLLLASGAGLVVLLLQRGDLSTRAAVAEESSRSSEERARAVEQRQAAIEAALKVAEQRLASADQEAARLTERASAMVLAREQDAREAERALDEALTGERRVHAEQLERERAVHRKELDAVRAAQAQLEANLALYQENLKSAFDALAGQALKRSSDEFLKLAETKLAAKSTDAAADLDRRKAEVERLVAPLADALRRTDEKLATIERDRTVTYGELRQQLEGIGRASAELRSETGRLSKALGKPDVRGRYGEWQLRRVVELVGLTDGRDFTMQDSTVDSDGNAQRPDMVLYLPHGRHLVVDAKTNTAAYMEAIEHEGVEREACLERFAQHVADQVTALGRKNYWRSYEGSPEFVVMFIPGDQYLDAALSRRRDLIETALRSRVIIATPTTLLGLLHAVALALQEHKLAQEAVTLRELGAELHGRVATALSYAIGLGKALNSSVEKYNEFIASAERNLLSTARRFEKEGVKSGKVLAADEALQPIVVRAELPTKAAPMLPFSNG